MISFLFWNMNGRDLAERTRRLAVNHDVDVLMLAECATSSAEMLAALNADGTRYYDAKGQCESIRIFARFNHEYITAIKESDRLTIRCLRPPGSQEILLAVAHLPSKLFRDNDSQDAQCQVLARELEKLESQKGHSRTILVGDLNMDPFQPGVVNAAGLHGVMTRETASRGTRKVDGRPYKFFYNPMWSLFGDANKGPAGTYYRGTGSHKVYFWHMLDQVLIRPELLDSFRNEDLAILDRDGEMPLVDKKGHPDRASGSDHLPIVFKLEI